MGRPIEPMPDIVEEYCELPDDEDWRDMTPHRRKLFKERAWRRSRSSPVDGKRQYVQKLKEEGSCIECGEDRTAALVYHHENPDEKKFSVSNPSGHSLEEIKEELEKCVLLCANCHMVEHYG